MKNLTFLLLAAAVLSLSTGAIAQSPSTSAGDPGAIVNAAPGLDLPIGWVATNLFNLQPLLSTPASMIVGHGGDLFFTETVGGGCNANSVTVIYRVAMSGGAPTQPLSITQHTSVPLDAHELVYDPATDAIYATGTCAQTGAVYKVSAAGVPQLLNVAAPLNDPDGIAIGTLPTKTGPQLFVTTQDGLFSFDLFSGPIPLMTQINVDLTAIPATALGNWGFPKFDPNTGTLLATNVGRPTTRNTVELTFLNATTAVASTLGPDNVHPMALDHQGIRWFRHSDEIGFINPGNVFVPVIISAGSTGRIADASAGNFYFLDTLTGDVSRLDRPMRVDALTISAAAGGVVPLDLNAPAPRGNEGYLVVCSVSGASPGTPWGNVTVPLNPDLITQVGIALAVSMDPSTYNWNGFLDANGDASAEMRFYPGIIPSGVTFNLTFIAGNPSYTANAAWIHVLP